jgi:hypothetical protein
MSGDLLGFRLVLPFENVQRDSYWVDSLFYAWENMHEYGCDEICFLTMQFDV